MPATELPNGLTLTHPDSVKVSSGGGLRRRRGRSAPARARRGAREPLNNLAPLLEALDGQGLQLVGRFELQSKPGRKRSAGGRRRTALPGVEGPSTLDVDLGPNEDAVVLTVDTNDDVDWVLPSGESVTGGQRRSRNGARKRRARFAIETTAAVPGRRRGLKSLVAKGVLGFVFRFIRAKITKKLIDHLEKDVAPGLVRVTSNVSADWTRLGPDGVLPKVAAKSGDGVPRVLLLIHGTFSSTIGSYGGLSFSSEGVALLDGVQERYDHVIGWDHRTLSEEPRPNAQQVKDSLDRLFPNGAVIDAIGYSRGGLVLRSLLEQIVPGTPWEGRFQQAIFVGCTLNGTKLAQEKNWKAFVNIYTNIAIAACRGVRLAVPPLAVATVWVETVARGIAALVRFLASALLDKGGIPGLTAMDPDKAVVKAFNAAAPAEALTAIYRAVTNDFEPGLADGAGNVLPVTFKIRAADALMDAQMNEPNDLVVNTSSMHHVGPGDLPEVQVRALPRNGRTIHTTYFRDPDVIAQLQTWLLGTTGGGVRRRSAASRRRARRPAKRAVKRTATRKRRVTRRRTATRA